MQRGMNQTRKRQLGLMQKYQRQLESGTVELASLLLQQLAICAGELAHGISLIKTYERGHAHHSEGLKLLDGICAAVHQADDAAIGFKEKLREVFGPEGTKGT